MSFIDHDDDGDLSDDALGVDSEPAPEGWSDDPREMRRLARILFDAGNYQGAAQRLEHLYELGHRYPINNNIAICYARMGDFETAKKWLDDALDDPAGPAPVAAADVSRAGMLERYYQWSKNRQHS